jgi:hypothetical protein
MIVELPSPATTAQQFNGQQPPSESQSGDDANDFGLKSDRDSQFLCIGRQARISTNDMSLAATYFQAKKGLEIRF